jgi:hypothetical protein
MADATAVASHWRELRKGMTQKEVATLGFSLYGKETHSGGGEKITQTGTSDIGTSIVTINHELKKVNVKNRFYTMQFTDGRLEFWNLHPNPDAGWKWANPTGKAFITKEEYLAWQKAKLKGLTEGAHSRFMKYCASHFDLLDVNRDGKLTKEEFYGQ